MEVLSQLSIEQFIGLQWLNNITRYLLIAGLTYMIFWKWGFHKFKDKFLYAEKPSGADIKREIFYSVLSTMIFLIPSFFIILVKDKGWTSLYWDISEKGMGWYAASYVIVFFLHDTYFYWTHRLMHYKSLYKYFHNVHHLSKKPTPMAAFAFHPLEAIVESLIFPLIAIFLPVHFSVIVLFSLFSLFMNVYGHLGFSMFTKKQLHSFPLKMFSHSTHHSWHHQFYKGNYGFYLQFWDRIMGTWKGELEKKH
jgi:lathosterol oxidase